MSECAVTPISHPRLHTHTHMHTHTHTQIYTEGHLSMNLLELASLASVMAEIRISSLFTGVGSLSAF